MTNAPLRDLLDALAAIEATPSAWAELSEGYRGGRPTPAGPAFNDAHARAYAVGRAPATSAAVAAVLDEVVERIVGWAPTTMIDAGAGLGTASWTAMAMVPSLLEVELVERSEAMIELGGGLAAHSRVAAVRDRRWRRSDAADLGEHRADVVLASYVLSELADRDAARAVEAWWAATTSELIVVDTGTPAGFDRVLAARDQLIDAGAKIVAPCPSAGTCPVAGTDWCHFSVRLARNDAHRRLKGAELSFEDEKFSYVVASRSAVPPARGRVVRHPQTRSGHIRLQVCHDDRITEKVVGRSRAEVYRWARKAAWGDAVPVALFDHD